MAVGSVFGTTVRSGARSRLAVLSRKMVLESVTLLNFPGRFNWGGGGRRLGGRTPIELGDEDWSGRRASNPLPQPWQGCALPSELLPRPRDRCHLTGGRRPRLRGPLHMIALMSVLTPGCCGFNYRSTTRLGGALEWRKIQGPPGSSRGALLPLLALLGLLGRWIFLHSKGPPNLV